MIETGWVKGPKQIGALDHLGIQAPWNKLLIIMI